MNSSNHPSAYGYQPNRRPAFQSDRTANPRPPVQEETLKSGIVQIERKSFVLALMENPRGRFVRITELGGRQSPAIIVPTTGLKDFNQVLAGMVQAEAEIPPKPAMGH